jgi:hypothetical protein
LLAFGAAREQVNVVEQTILEQHGEQVLVFGCVCVYGVGAAESKNLGEIQNPVGCRASLAAQDLLHAMKHMSDGVLQQELNVRLE